MWVIVITIKACLEINILLFWLEKWYYKINTNDKGPNIWMTDSRAESN